MSWNQVVIDIKSEISLGKSGGLNLIGHSLVPSPIDPKELYIFGGRKSDENITSSTLNSNNNFRNSRATTASSFIFVLNLDTLILSELPISNLSNDTLNLPEPRLNQLFVRRSEQLIQFKPPVVEEKPSAKKGKGSRRAPPLPVKRPKLQPHPIITLFGGSKLYSSGFCSGTMYDLYFVPIEKKESNWVEQVEAMTETPEQETKKDIDDNMSSRLTISTTASRKMSAMQLVVETQSDPNEIFHMLNIKENSSTKLLSPKRGIGAQYFTLKTHLSRSRSTFSRPGTSNGNNLSMSLNIPGGSSSSGNIGIGGNNSNLMMGNNSSSRLTSPPSPVLPDIRTRRPASAPSTSLFTTSKNDLTNLNETSNFPLNSTSFDEGIETNSPPDSPSQIRKHIDPIEKIKSMSTELCPLVKGMSVHEARLLFNQMHPLYSSASVPANLHHS